MDANELKFNANPEKTDYSQTSNVKLDMNNFVTLTWEHINVFSEQENQLSCKNCKKGQLEDKHILKNVDGIAKSGQLLAIMGSSGSGKTTLFNCLNFRNKKNLRMTGTIKINGTQISSAKTLSFISGYVEQDDSFIDVLTVKEHLKFHAMLRLGKNTSKSERDERVNTVINDLNLQKCEDTLIGDAEKGIKGISTGEKRRLAVATELLRNVNLLMADEPTSGLDSFMASAIIECLVKLARQGKTIICTIHQPSSEIFNMFDQLYLLAEGRVAFLGSLNEATEFFKKQQLYCPKNYNPADFYIQKLAVLPSKRDICLENVNRICDNFCNSENYRLVIKDIDQANNQSTVQNFLQFSLAGNFQYTSTTFNQLRALLWRSSINAIRDRTSSLIRIFQVIFFGIMFGLIYFKQDLSQKSIQNINGILYTCLIELSFITLIITTTVFSPELPIILKEHANGMYRIINYFISHIIAELPINILLPTIYISIIYCMVNLNNQFDRFLICVLVLILSTNIAVAFADFISSLSSSVKVATQIVSPLLVPLNVFAGYYLNKRSVPSYLSWFKYLSWIGYANEVLLINQWDGVNHIKCIGNSTCLHNGDQILNDLEMNKSNFYFDIVAMTVSYFVLRILTYLMLLYKAI